MSRHFVPPLPTPSTSGRVSYQLVQGNDEHDSSPTIDTSENAQHHELFPVQEEWRKQSQNRYQTTADHDLIRKEEQDVILKPASASSQLEGEIEQSKWPPPFDDEVAIQNNTLHLLPSDRSQIIQEVETFSKITVRSITWNQQAQELPSIEILREHLLPRRYYHVIAVGTQECENSITKSILYPSKDNWEKTCRDALGDEYELVRGHSLQASHLAVFVHKAMMHLVSKVDSHAVATGLCDTLGNKGGIAITIRIGKTNICFLTAHLAAHQNQMDRRTAEFIRISREVAKALGPKEKTEVNIEGDDNDTLPDTLPGMDSDHGSEKDCFEDNCLTQGVSERSSITSDESSNRSCCFCPHCPKPVKECSFCRCLNRKDEKYNPLSDAFDHVIWGGDLNFRIHGTRDIVDSLLAHNRHNILVDNDQLNMVMQFDKVFAGFVEGPLSFRPTYKFDKGSDVYDTSPKRRIPAWTDRILYKPSPAIDLISYSSASGIRNSDHRPVYASFQCSINIDGSNFRRSLLRTESKSEVCIIS